MESKVKSSDDLIIIVNRSKEYKISKKLICEKVPYFKSMFSCDLKEVKENKVILDLDEKGFDSIICWIRFNLLAFKMETLNPLIEIADYLMMNEIKSKCIEVFYKNFNLEFIPLAIGQASEFPKLMLSEHLNSFICEHFLKLINTEDFPNYSIETIEYILKLDLVIYSEYQIFEAILKWIEKESDSRECHLLKLLELIRWCNLSDEDMKKIEQNSLIQKQENFKSLIYSSIKCNSFCEFNRCKQNYFIAVYKKQNNLQIALLNDNLECLSCEDFIFDKSLSLDFFHESNISDIFYDSQQQGIRVDWTKKTFNWINNVSEIRFQFLVKYFYDSWPKILYYFGEKNYYWYCAKVYRDSKPKNMNVKSFSTIETFDRIILVIKDDNIYSFASMGYFDESLPPHNIPDNIASLNGKIFILKENLEFIYQLDDLETLKKNCELMKNYKHESFRINDLSLTSHQGGDVKVVLVHKKTGNINIFNEKTNKWSYIGQMSKDDIFAFTSAFVPKSYIQTLSMQ